MSHYTDEIKRRQKEDFLKPKDIQTTNSWKLFKIMSEFVEGYTALGQHSHEITVFGSARLPEDNLYYKEAKRLGELLAIHNYTTITGGGPGIMEAANKGAHGRGGTSIGLGIKLPHEQDMNPYVTQSVNFSYFFTRKVMLTAPSQAFVFFPGGFGTMDEFFQVLNETNLGFTQRVPIILVGPDYWQPLLDFLNESCISGVHTLTDDHLRDIRLVEDAEEAFEIIEQTEDIPNISSQIMRGPQDQTSMAVAPGMNWRIFRIMAEFVEGLDFVGRLENIVTILGTSSLESNTRYYNSIYQIADQVSEDGFHILTGGSPGLPEAANKAARDNEQDTYGIVLNVDDQPRLNEYLSQFITFDFPFTRQFIVTAPSKSYIYGPGGLGTLHQLFEVLTLEQTEKTSLSPLLLFDKPYWKPLVDFIDNTLHQEFETISPEDVQLFKMTNSEIEVTRIIREYNE
jgi:uncharacterized protein (TIGR00730 family)